MSGDKINFTVLVSFITVCCGFFSRLVFRKKSQLDTAVTQCKMLLFSEIGIINYTEVQVSIVVCYVV